MAICAGGAVAGIQLVHGGPQADPALTGGVTVGPSEVAPAVGEPEPVELTSAQVLEIEERFLAAAVRAANAGFEFIELHAAHGYLLDSFVSPIRNHRGDAFGGTMANRMRIISDILLRLKARLGGRAAVGARISVFNHIADGFGMADLQAMVRILQDCGSDFVDLSVDRALRRAFGAELTMGQVARGATQLPVLVAGGITTPVDAETVIAEGHGDIVCVGRAMLASADWSERAIRELPAPG
jgi:2,4-dienoyl-CoA reductase-like NADH-dependent reductase (Old Yellow Enzyme family)